MAVPYNLIPGPHGATEWGELRAEATARVSAEAAAVVAIIERCGPRAITDVFPHGGCHVYVLSARPVSWTELCREVCALARRFPTTDEGPMNNPAGRSASRVLPQRARRPPQRIQAAHRPSRRSDRRRRKPNPIRLRELLHDELVVERSSSSSAPGCGSTAGTGHAQPVAGGRLTPDDEGTPWLPRRPCRRAPTITPEGTMRVPRRCAVGRSGDLTRS
jgi:hypothetical protein